MKIDVDIEVTDVQKTNLALVRDAPIENTFIMNIKSILGKEIATTVLPITNYNVSIILTNSNVVGSRTFILTLPFTDEKGLNSSLNMNNPINISLTFNYSLSIEDCDKISYLCAHLKASNQKFYAETNKANNELCLDSNIFVVCEPGTNMNIFLNVPLRFAF